MYKQSVSQRIMRLDYNSVLAPVLEIAMHGHTYLSVYLASKCVSDERGLNTHT